MRSVDGSSRPGEHGAKSSGRFRLAIKSAPKFFRECATFKWTLLKVSVFGWCRKIGTTQSCQNGDSSLLQEAQEALRMVEEKISKGQSQRKRRHERETCINNLKLNVNISSTKADYVRSRPGTTNTTKNRSEDKYARGSLDNVSRITADERTNLDDQSSLRRTRSLAISRENLFYSLDYTETSDHRKNRRSQLIPRARLIERSLVRDSRNESFQVETTTKRPSNKPQEIPPDYSPLPRPQSKNFPLDSWNYKLPPGYTTRNCSPALSPKNNRSRKSLEDFTGLSLPNYYPDSEDNLTDNQSEDKKYVSLDNLTWETATIPYDENIVFAKKSPEGVYAKPRTIRGPTPHHKFDYKSLPQFNNEGGKEAVERVIESEQQSSLEFETNTNCDEIKLNNENIRKEESEPEAREPIKTLIEVCSERQAAEDFKSVVVVTGTSPKTLEEEAKNHSHKYLKEFLESQKGSKRPLQSFIAKKFSNLTRRHSKSNLTTNQFYSLPDINASKSLQKCEKIDKKLRSCDKVASSENRFIVNIGNHFDVTDESTTPVDFQVKITKKQTAEDRDRAFREAVRHVNNTLQGNGFSVDLNNNEELMDAEIQEKVDNMRSYWTKMAGDKDEAAGERCKIVEIHSKVDNVKKKFELNNENREERPGKVELAKQVFEPKSPSGKISPVIKESCNYFENCMESLCPGSVELLENERRPKKSLTKAKSVNVPEFDHVRYKVIKPELFNKKILANCETAEQFNDVMKYLQDYSFQELFIDNNIVIIEPIRSKIPHSSKTLPKRDGKPKREIREEADDVKQGLRKHFFYQPIRVNKEVNDDELPNPEVVKQARQFFEMGTNNAKERQRESGVDLDKDKCSTTSACSDDDRDDAEEENMYDSLDCCSTEYVSEDILEKIREYGTTVTYYGGRVVDRNPGQPILTKVIMEEIKNNEKRCMECSGCRRRSMDKTLNEVSREYQGFKFKIVKSNSCNSRLELMGTADKNRLNKNEKRMNKDTINESIKRNENKPNQPRIIGEERKATDANKVYIQWSELKKEKANGAQTNRGMKNYDYHEKVTDSRKSSEMEFEPYEVA
ncbi:protein javelin isoform X1 [Euwallacea fornicatus]|uniref:protein javelin isoform X1 n=2 Tax=Euwallacea fornicatus TaxID=995702 RepID=UPI00338EA3B0